MTAPLGHAREGEFLTERLVRFSHCDPAGIVYFPNYFDLLNGVVEDWWSSLGVPWTTLVTERQIGTPTARLVSEFLRPSLMGETLCFRLWVERLGNASLTLRHIAEVAGETRLRVEQVLVATSLATHRSIPWPEDIRARIEQFMEVTDHA